VTATSIRWRQRIWDMLFWGMVRCPSTIRGAVM